MRFFFFFIMKGLKILIVKVAEFGNPSKKKKKKHWQTEVLIMCFEVF